SILNSLTPLNTLFLGAALFGLAVKRTQVIGVSVGLIGTALLIFSGAMSHPEQNYWFAGFVLVATLCYATNVNLVKKYLSDVPPVAITTGNFVVLLVPAIIILLCSNFFEIIHAEKVQHAIFFVMILGIMGTGIANVFFYKLIQMSSPVFATSVTYLIPIVAFFWGLLDHETLTSMQIVGALIILVGVYLSGKK
ncbi:MAG TPA: DMT family transporter, partial [Flavobacterium sp.]|nr:DMT family transporter [Flavobacterium sp.]